MPPPISPGARAPSPYNRPPSPAFNRHPSMSSTGGGYYPPAHNTPTGPPSHRSSTPQNRPPPLPPSATQRNFSGSGTRPTHNNSHHNAHGANSLIATPGEAVPPPQQQFAPPTSLPHAPQYAAPPPRVMAQHVEASDSTHIAYVAVATPRTHRPHTTVSPSASLVSVNRAGSSNSRGANIGGGNYTARQAPPRPPPPPQNSNNGGYQHYDMQHQSLSSTAGLHPASPLESAVFVTPSATRNASQRPPAPRQPHYRDIEHQQQPLAAANASSTSVSLSTLGGDQQQQSLTAYNTPAPRNGGADLRQQHDEEAAVRRRQEEEALSLVEEVCPFTHSEHKVQVLYELHGGLNYGELERLKSVRSAVPRIMAALARREIFEEVNAQLAMSRDTMINHSTLDTPPHHQQQGRSGNSSVSLDDVWVQLRPGQIQSVYMNFPAGDANSNPSEAGSSISLLDAEWPIRIYVAVRCSYDDANDVALALQCFAEEQDAFAQVIRVYQQHMRRLVAASVSVVDMDAPFTASGVRDGGARGRAMLTTVVPTYEAGPSYAYGGGTGNASVAGSTPLRSRSPLQAVGANNTTAPGGGSMIAGRTASSSSSHRPPAPKQAHDPSVHPPEV